MKTKTGKKKKVGTPLAPKRTKVALFTWITPELDNAMRAMRAKRDVTLATLVSEALEDAIKKFAKK